ncbi:broad specificity phosphatase PhoE [Paenibacillus anaericanus]|uniref:histidine phosphatase family protein n=1 Tax=Paenibacillus anaericanus TaxID=170367 RepID=UPI00278122A0|nr:histidine phosphatase family protein [Paenibacillus anaericanus]MDQ0090274.1 broad specificity phosphatase PhoE [Paenibacillus anaericanus]
MHLYVIRHSQSTMNVGLGGGANCGLSEIGLWQAEQIPPFFENIPIKSIFCSPLKRAIMTALPLTKFKDMPLILVPQMSEMFFGKWTDYRDYSWESCETIVSDYLGTQFLQSHDTSNQWWPVWPETQADVRVRVQSFFDAEIAPYLGTDEHIVVFGHGQSTADLKQVAKPGDTIPVYNAGIVEFVLDSTGKCLSAEVHTDHLGPHVSD